MSLIQLVKETDFNQWDWNDLSANPNISVADIMTHPSHPWNLSFLLTNPSLSLCDIEHIASTLFQTRMEDLLHQENHSIMISRNHGIPLEWFLTHSSHLRFSFYDLAIHQHASIDLLEGEYAHLFNNHRVIMMGNSSIPIDDILDHVQRFPHDVSPILSTHKGILYDHIQEFPEIYWHWPTLSAHPNMTPDIVEAYPHQAWYTHKFWTNPSFYLDDIQRLVPQHHRTFYSSTYSMNPSLRFQDIQDFPDIPWRWRFISKNPGIMIRDIRTNLGQPWMYVYVSKNTFHPWRFDYTHTTSMERLKYTKEYVSGIKDELLMKTWGNPSRMIDWCLEHDERTSFLQRWSLSG